MNKEERIQYVLDSIKDNVAVNIALSLVEECDELQQENKKYKEVIDKAKEWEQTHTILVYTKEAPRQFVGTHELLHILYDKEVE